ncbi:MAG: hypothetical protein ACD_56C00070G0001, partial [uncultured bacterium]
MLQFFIPIPRMCRVLEGQRRFDGPRMIFPFKRRKHDENDLLGSCFAGLFRLFFWRQSLGWLGSQSSSSRQARFHQQPVRGGLGGGPP